jgi:hypothetical protein
LFSSSQEEEEPREGKPPQHSTTCPSTRSKPDRYRLPSFRLWNDLTLKSFPCLGEEETSFEEEAHQERKATVNRKHTQRETDLPALPS